MSLKHPCDYYEKHYKIYESSFERDKHELVRLEGKRDEVHESLQKAAEEIHERVFKLYADGKKLKTMADYLKLDDAVIKSRNKLFESHVSYLVQVDKTTAKEREEAKKKVAEFQKTLKELVADRATVPKNSSESKRWLGVDAEYYSLSRESKGYFEDLKEKFKPCSVDKLKKRFILNQPVTNKTFVEVQLEDCEI